MALSAISRSAGLWLLLILATPLASAYAMDTRHFVEQAVSTDVTATKAAELALRTSDSADVKDFAQRVIDSYPRSKADLQAFARTQQVELPGDEEVLEHARAELEALENGDFDLGFAELQARSFEQQVNLFSEAAEQGDEDLQSFARAKLPVLKSQLQMARMLTRAHPQP